jgi:hypothetical protein
VKRANESVQENLDQVLLELEATRLENVSHRSKAYLGFMSIDQPTQNI